MSKEIYVRQKFGWLINGGIAFAVATVAASAALAQNYSGSAADSAYKSGGQQQTTQMASYMMAAALASQCGRWNKTACVMAAMAAAQGASLGSTAGGAYNFGDALSTTGNGTQTGTTLDTNRDTTGGSGVNSTGGSYEKIKSTLEGKGALISGDGSSITLPDGQSVSTSVGASESSLRDAGFSDSDISAGMAALKDAQNQVKSKLKAQGALVVEGGGGGTRNGTAGGGSGGGGFNMNFKLPGMENDKKEVSLSGMTKNLGGEKIGVAGDDIFQMITRRYKAADQGNSFLKH